MRALARRIAPGNGHDDIAWLALIAILVTSTIMLGAASLCFARALGLL
jgi:hypothetical protein